MLQTSYSLALSPLNLHGCKALAPSAITALNLETGKRVWEHPLVTSELGGPIVSPGGLVLAAGTREPYLRAFDKLTGEELWSGRLLPAPAQATHDLHLTCKAVRCDRRRRSWPLRYHA
jgi:glucose dehydrogenase